jgi:7,8-dihydropterin-6-yl-methyl-4-(beta-D-ribofuranosyl)aminobenzene 5'-phosphate synthase
MKIAVLIEDTLDKKAKGLVNEHGLSLFIETNNKRILFDVGASANTINNAKALNVDLTQLDDIVISHAHNDHGGGLSALLDLNQNTKVSIRDFGNKSYYFKEKVFIDFIGLDKEMLRKYKKRMRWIKKDKVDYYFLFSSIDTKVKIKRNNKKLLMKKENNNTYIHDDFNHEQVMIIKEKGKNYLISACSHKGIKNIIESVKSKLGIKKINCLIGGLHLVNNPIKRTPVSKSELQRVARYLNKNVDEVYTCHCTGDMAYKILKETLGKRINYIRTGTKFEV